MQIKFITLTVSAILALSAVAANAAPTGQESTKSSAESKAVQAQQPADIAPANKAAPFGDSDNLLDIVGDLVDDVVDPLIKAVLEAVHELLEVLLNPEGYNLREGIVNKLLRELLELLGLEEGHFTGGRPPRTEPRAPKGDNPVELILCFVKNLLDGHSSNAAAGGSADGLLEIITNLLQGLLGGEEGPQGGRQGGSHGGSHRGGSSHDSLPGLDEDGKSSAAADEVI